MRLVFSINRTLSNKRRYTEQDTRDYQGSQPTPQKTLLLPSREARAPKWNDYPHLAPDKVKNAHGIDSPLRGIQPSVTASYRRENGKT